MRRLLPALAALALLGFGPRLAMPGPAEGLTVFRATVVFGSGGGSRIRLHGQCASPSSLAAFDPAGGDVRFTLGPADLLPGYDTARGVRIRNRGMKGWEVVLRRPFAGRGRASLRLDHDSGYLDLRARGFDGGAMLAAGPAGVAALLRLGDQVGTDGLDFVERGDRRWDYHRVVVRRPPGGGGDGGGGGGPPEPVGATTVARGAWSSFQGFRFEVVKDDPTWQALWQSSGGSGTAPYVDFSQEIVIGYWLGSRPTGGYSVDILRVISPVTVIGAPGSPDGAMADIQETQPGPGCTVTQGETRPFHIVRTPRVEGPGMYELTTVVKSCP
jgi:hypothetical protein